MKRLYAILFLLIAACAVRAQTADPAIITNDTEIVTWSDSYTRAQYGNRQNDFLASFFINYYPQFWIDYRDHSRSGDSNLGMLTNRIPMLGPVDWSATGGKSNVLNIYYSSANAAPTSNTLFSQFADILKAPAQTYTRFALITNDWPQSPALFKSIVIGDIAYRSVNGDVSSRDRSYGARNAALAAGWPFVDTFVNLSNSIVSAFLNSITTNAFWFDAPAFDHPANEIHLCWALTTLTNPTNNNSGLGVDTNTWTGVVNFNAASVATTNHCTITGVSRVGNVLTMTFHADRMAPTFDVPDGTITNDCRGAFTLMPALGNAFCEILRVTNLPAGNYVIGIDGSNCIYTTDVQLSAGYNCFTNYTGAFWAQKKEGLGLLRDMMDILRSTASDDAHLGDNRLLERYESYAQAVWPTNNVSVSSYIAQHDMLDREAELQAEDVLIHANAQQTNHTITISLIVPRYAPAHR